MKLSTLQLGTGEQLIRYVLTWFGSILLGASIAEGEMFQGAVGGAVAIGSFVWWFFRNRAVHIKE